MCIPQIEMILGFSEQQEMGHSIILFQVVYMPPSKHMTGNYTNGAGPFTETRPGA